MTGWDNGLNQDYNRKLGRWFADRLGAREQLRRDFQMNTKELIKQLRFDSRVDSIFGDDVRKKITEQAADTIQALQAEVDALKAYAERYRWLRDDANNVSKTAPLVFNAPGDGSEMKWTYALYGEKLDAAIDAAKGNV